MEDFTLLTKKLVVKNIKNEFYIFILGDGSVNTKENVKQITVSHVKTGLNQNINLYFYFWSRDLDFILNVI